MNARARTFRDLESAMPKSSSFLKHLLPLVYAVVAVPTFAVLLLVLFYEADRFGLLGGRPACITKERARTSGLSGFDFEISETACFHDLGVSVFASCAGERKKALLFKYTPLYVGPYPTITPIGEHTVQISVSRVSSIFCRRDRWEGLTVNMTSARSNTPA
jgi:hypothetical protein